MVNQTVFPVPLIHPNVPSYATLDTSSNTLLNAPFTNPPYAFDVSSGAYGEENVYTYTVVSGATAIVNTYIETDTIVWDSTHNIVYRHIEIDGPSGPFLNEIDVVVSTINEIYDPSGDNVLVGEIQNLVNQIKCTRAEGMGTLNHYAELLDLAKDISQNVSLTLDVSGLKAFADVAKTYGDIFDTITQSLTHVTEVDSTPVLTAIKAELEKIAAMYASLGALKLEITRAATLRIPDSIQGTADQLQLVFNELDCTLDYLEYFCDPSGYIDTNGNAPANSTLNDRDRAALDAAKGALGAYKTIVENQGVISASNNTQVQNLNAKVQQFTSIKSRLEAAATCLTSGLAGLGSTKYAQQL